MHRARQSGRGGDFAISVLSLDDSLGLACDPSYVLCHTACKHIEPDGAEIQQRFVLAAVTMLG